MEMIYSCNYQRPQDPTVLSSLFIINRRVGHMLLLLGVYTASITIEILPLFRSMAKSQVSDRCQLQGC